jgi:hypothetical protein
MTKDEAKACMSLPPDFSSDIHDTWDFEDHRLVVHYLGAGGTIKRVSLTTAF